MSIVNGQVQDQIVTKNKQGYSQKADMSGLSFLQSMSDLTAINREVTTAYVHPIEKRSVSKLNEKSLEMCTESLGTETGSESGEELSLLAFEATVYPRVPKPKEEEDTNLRAKKSTIFPPPIKVEYNRMVRTLGEDGRLIVQAIRVSTPPLCFVAERCEGRLRLSLSLEEEEEEAEEENIEKVEGKTGNKNIRKLSSRCKENGLEPKPMQFWVAT